MKQKVGTILDEEILRRLKEEAVRERRSMNAIVEEALASYFAGKSRDVSLRLSSVERLCSRPFHLSLRRLAALLEEDGFDQ
jgi:predicted transcriptional regulator